MAIRKTKGRAEAGRNGGIVALDPTSGPLEKPSGRTLAARPDDLDGQVIGLVTNGLGRSQEFMSALSDELAKISRPGGVIHVVKNSVSIAPERADWARLTSEASVAITGFGG
jgi:hypothetical protein